MSPSRSERRYALPDILDAVDEMVREDDYAPEVARRRIVALLEDCAAPRLIPITEAEALAEALEWIERFTSDRGDARMMDAGQARSQVHRRVAAGLAAFRSRHPKGGAC